MCICPLYHKYILCMLQAKDKGASAVIIGIIIGCAPFSLVILSPIFGYLVSGTHTYQVM